MSVFFFCVLFVLNIEQRIVEQRKRGKKNDERKKKKNELKLDQSLLYVYV